jgi:hypothetical protein
MIDTISRDINGLPKSPLNRFLTLALGKMSPTPGVARIALALIYGMFCHAVFGLAVLAMIVGMFFGMSESFGRVPAPSSVLANIALVVQILVRIRLTAPEWRL